MTIEEAAAMLLMSTKQVGHLARSKQISGRKIGRAWDLDEQAVREWKLKHHDRLKTRGRAWRKGILIGRRQWRCRNCGTIGTRDENLTCSRCGEPQPSKELKETPCESP